MLLVAAFLTVVLAVGHSYLGERYILIRLFRRQDLPKLFGGTEFTTRTLRFAWHLTSLAWLSLGAILVKLNPTSRREPSLAISWRVPSPRARSWRLSVREGVTCLGRSSASLRC